MGQFVSWGWNMAEGLGLGPTVDGWGCFMLDGLWLINGSFHSSGLGVGMLSYGPGLGWDVISWFRAEG